jgi:two-component system, OmpR family, osmolarity sensor histidine kinase EnvZ
MKLLPRTLFWRVFWAQMLLMIVFSAVIVAFIASKQAETTAEDMAILWAPAVKEVIREYQTGQVRSVRVVKNMQILQKSPPADAMTPRASARFFWLLAALRQQGLPVRDMRVSGVSGNSVVWLALGESGSTTQWLGVISNIEGEDLPRRFLIALVVAMILSAALAAVLSHMVTKPARMIAKAVRDEMAASAFDAPSIALPASGAAEIMTIANSVAETLTARRALERERQIVLSGISHDIRSPLARIRLAAQLLRAEGEMVELQQRITRNVDVIDDLVEGFAYHLRAEIDESKERINVRAIIDALVAEGSAIDVRVDVAPVSIPGNYHLLFRALANLLDNAIQHGKPPIDIKLRHLDDHEIAIDVLNEGEPIDVADVSRLLKPFERGESHRATPGSGLGLAIVARVAQRHGGRLELASRNDVPGTRATIVLACR